MKGKMKYQNIWNQKHFQEGLPSKEGGTEEVVEFRQARSNIEKKGNINN